MRTVVLYNLLTSKGGGERVALTLSRAFNADIWTTNYVPDTTFSEYHSFNVFSHPLTAFRLSSALKDPNPLWQGLIQTEAVFKYRKMDLSCYDLIISSGLCTKHIAIQDKNHPCIHYEHGVKESYRLERFFKMWTQYMKKLDYEATRKIDVLVCNSENTKKKINRHYHREAQVVYPPVDIKKFKFGEAEDYFLAVERISPRKGIEIQLEAFRRVPEQKLVIIGSPQKSHVPYHQKLIRLAPKNVTFLGGLLR